MAATGYSGTPIVKKPGILPGTRLLLMNTPVNYFELLQSDLKDQLIKGREIPQLVHFFAENEAEFLKRMKKIIPVYKKNTGLVTWVSWYKKTAGIRTSDLIEDAIRNYALQHDLVDIKVCAVSELWSGLKLVVPLAKR